jgi:hypothetical protein
METLCLISANGLAHPGRLSQISWATGNSIRNAAGLVCVNTHPAAASKPPFVFIAPLHRAPIAPGCREHSSPLKWLDNTHCLTAELKGKAAVQADFAAMGAMSSQHLAPCGCLYPRTRGHVLRNGTVEHVTALHVDTPQAGPDTLSTSRCRAFLGTHTRLMSVALKGALP